MSLYWSSGRPNVLDVLGCLGSPDAYRALYRLGPDGIRSEVDLYYPRSGIVVGLTPVPGKQGAPLSSQPLSGIVFARPTPTSIDLQKHITEMSIALSRSSIETDMSLVKPWPGDIRKLEFSDVVP